MKKITSAILVIVMLVLAVSLVGCSGTGNLKLGVGVYSEIDKISNADGETKGSSNVIHTVAAVLVDGNGKIVKCTLDATDNKAQYTSEGAFVAASEFKTKNELGDAYNMKTYGGSTYEWYEQAEKFATLTEGKTVDEVKALVATDGKGTSDVVTAGCTIAVTEFVKAIENAVAVAKDSSATADSELNLGIVSTQSQSNTKNATEEADGAIVIDTTMVASAVKNGKVTASVTDVVSVTFTFNAKGEGTTDKTKTITTKATLGANYNMAAHGADRNGDGVVKEWFEQAAAFDAACIGKTADEIAALVVNGYGVESVQNAGCTIDISDMVKAAVKAAK